MKAERFFQGLVIGLLIGFAVGTFIWTGMDRREGQKMALRGDWLIKADTVKVDSIKVNYVKIK